MIVKAGIRTYNNEVPPAKKEDSESKESDSESDSESEE